MMKLTGSLLLASLLCGCATNMAPIAAPTPGDNDGSEMVDNLAGWPTNLVLDLFDIFDANMGTGKNDYPFGAHLQFTKLIRVGIFDMADLEILGIRNMINDGGEDMMNFDQAAGDYMVGMKLGFGAGAGLAIDLYEIYDWVVGVVTFNQFNPSEDH
ncbi:MAG: hypothetical protein V2A76_05860 [Planctomycetota bacterium]